MYIERSACIVLCSTEFIVSHYRQLWASMWLLGIEFQAPGRTTVSALNCWAIFSPAQKIIVCICTCKPGYAWLKS